MDNNSDNLSRRTLFHILPEVQQMIHRITGVTMYPVMPPALPGGLTA